MKQALLLYAAFFLLLSCNKKATIIKNPEYDSSNTDMIQISKIELTDTATILFTDAYNRPNNWVSISSGTVLKGKYNTYKLRGSEGFELDKEIYMPESGNVSFKLFFDPVDKQEESVDFAESEDPNFFRITGIKLYEVPVPDKPVKCILKGEVIDRPFSSRLVLSKEGEDIRTAKVVYLPIRDGKFEYTLNCDVEEAYELTFFEEHMNGSWRPCKFIAENGEINLTLYPIDDFEKNVIKGGSLNDEKTLFGNTISNMYKAVTDEIEELMEEGRFYTKESMDLRNQIENMDKDNPKRKELIEKYMELDQSEKNLTDEANVLTNKYKEVSKEIDEVRLKYAKENQTIVGYNIVMQEIRTAIQLSRVPGMPAKDIIPLVDIYTNIYKEKYPDHPYTLQLEKTLMGESVKVGNPYVDVTTEDLEGKEIKLSELIKGKVAMLHLWASWCGPCRGHGKDLIPIYEQYKDKGFTVVGIARENNRNAMISAREKDGYPWQDFLELNDKNSIWTKYGIGNAGGGDFLIDSQGKIIAISPTVEEINNILKELLEP